MEKNAAGFRRIPGTALRNGYGDVYTPPSPEQIPDLMADLEAFINDDELFALDPLIKMALIHYQFESIHPFYDGNGRTGRILNVLYLVKNALLDIPVLYMSRHIVRTKDEYYRRLQAVRDNDAWEDWVEYMLKLFAKLTVQRKLKLLPRWKLSKTDALEPNLLFMRTESEDPQCTDLTTENF